MSLPEVVTICLLRQRRVFIITFVAALAALVALTYELPKVYEAQATVAVGASSDGGGSGAQDPDFDVLTRTYAELLKTPSRAQAVVAALPFATTVSDLQRAASFDPVTGTRLLRIRAHDNSPQRARLIANTYAQILVDQQVRQARAAAEKALGDLGARVARLSADVRRLTPPRNPREETELRIAREELSAVVATYRSVEADTVRRSSDVTVASRAALPNTPVRPKPRLYLFVGSILCLVLAMAAALLRNAFDERIEDEEDIAAALGAPVLGWIPTARQSSEAEVADAFQVLRSNLQLTDVERRVQVVAVVAGGREEGKTTVLTGLAGAFGLADANVIAVDCDLRRPTLHRQLGGNAERGVSTQLAQSSAQSAKDAPLQPTPLAGVRLLAAGPLPANPPVLLTTGQLPLLLRQLESEADLVLVDTPPITLVADASIVAAAVDGVLVVVDSRKARPARLAATRDRLDKAGARVLGVVLNRVRPGSGRNRSYTQEGAGGRSRSRLLAMDEGARN